MTPEERADRIVERGFDRDGVNNKHTSQLAYEITEAITDAVAAEREERDKHWLGVSKTAALVAQGMERARCAKVARAQDEEFDSGTCQHFAAAIERGEGK